MNKLNEIIKEHLQVANCSEHYEEANITSIDNLLNDVVEAIKEERDPSGHCEKPMMVAEYRQFCEQIDLAYKALKEGK